MKAPLRYAFGWVLYVAIFCAVAPVVRAVLAFFEGYPLDFAITVLFALLGFLLLWWFLLRVFWRWCDALRKPSREGI